MPTHRPFEVEGNDPGPERDLGEAAELHPGGHVLRHVPQRGHLLDEAADAALGAAAVAPSGHQFNMINKLRWGNQNKH